MYGARVMSPLELRVVYPRPPGSKMVLRTEQDWNKDLQPSGTSTDGTVTTFQVNATRPYLYFKPCLVTQDGQLHWSVGSNYLALNTARGPFADSTPVGNTTRGTLLRQAVAYAIDRPALDASNYRDVERALRERTTPEAPLVIDWSGVVYVDFLGMEMVLDVLIQRTAPVVFVGVSRDLAHLLLRMQLAPVIPCAADAEAGRRLLGCGS